MSVAISTTEQDGRLTVGVAGEVDVSNADELRAAVDAALALDVARVEVNLAEVPYIDSTGIGVLVGAAHRAVDAHKRLVVSNPQRNVARVLSLLGVDGELGVGGARAS